jgi:hypothetical protein
MDIFKWGQIIGSTLWLLLALVLGAVAMAFFALNFPETLSQFIGVARQVKVWLASSVLPARYNVWLELLLEERQLVFMFFTLAARLFLAVVSSLFWWLIGRGSR